MYISRRRAREAQAMFLWGYFVLSPFVIKGGGRWRRYNIKINVSRKTYIIRRFQDSKYPLILIHVGTHFLNLLRITSQLITGKFTMCQVTF